MSTKSQVRTFIRWLCHSGLRTQHYALGTLIFCSACSPAQPRADLCFVQSAEPETIDPAMVTDQVSMRIEESLFEGLCRNNEKGQAEPGMAEKWEVGADKKHYTFHLRDKALWSNGEPVTANDFVQSWKRALDPALGADYASQLYLVKNAKAYNESTLKDFAQKGSNSEFHPWNPYPICAT